MERIDSPDGLFHEGNPGTGEKGTKVTAVWLNELQELAIGLGGAIQTKAVEYTLLESDGLLFATPAGGASVSYHLPVYATVSSNKRYKIKNIGEGRAVITAADGKTIDGDETLIMAPGDRCELAKDGTNWQTI